MSQIRTNSIVPAGGIPAGASGGGIIQVVSVTKTDTFQTSSTTFTDVTGMSVTITPRSTSNKIFASLVINTINSSGSDIVALQLVRGSTGLGLGDAAGSRPRSTHLVSMASSPYSLQHAAYEFLDAPATTSATTYKLQVRVKTGTCSVNRTDGDADGVDGHRTSSTFTVMEISG